jgi:hypothetical protein
MTFYIYLPFMTLGYVTHIRAQRYKKICSLETLIGKFIVIVLTMT